MELWRNPSLLAPLKPLILFIFIGFNSSSPFASEPLGQQVPAIGDALDKAYEYTFKTGGIGIVLGYGTGNGISAEEMGGIFVKEFKKQGYQAQYFYYNAKWEGIAMTFRIGYSSLGPWNPDEAAANLGEITARAKAAHKVHGVTK